MAAWLAQAVVFLAFYCAASLADGTAVPYSRSPAEILEFHVDSESGHAISAIRLVEVKDNQVVELLPFHSTKLTGPISDLKWNVLWKEDGSAAAVTVSDPFRSEIAAFVQTKSGDWEGININASLNDQLGKLGRPSADFVKIEHRPLEWQDTSDSSYWFWVQTQFWDKSGERYTLKEPILINGNGEYLGR